MKPISTLLAIFLLAVFVTWLSVGGLISGAARFDEALVQLDRIMDTEAALQRDILSARAGLLRNYDPLVVDTRALDGEIEQLRASVASDAPGTAAIDHLAASVAVQEDRVELFKSTNALLQNSLAYFAMFSANLTRPGQDESLAAGTGVLAAAVLRLTLDTSQPTVLAAQIRLDEFAARMPPGGSEAAAALLKHGQLLHDLLPSADNILRSIFATPLRADQAAVRSIVLQRQDALRISSRRSRFLLYITSLCLVGLLAWASTQLLQRTRAMRRRARFEHVLAAMSIRFLTASPLEVETAIDEALKEMALCVGAERSYFVQDDPHGRRHQWSGPGIEFPPGWPMEALLLSQRDYPSFDGVTQVVQVPRLPPGADRDALAAAGLQGWACVSARATDGHTAVLGFDAVTHPCRIMRGGELGLLRMALDTILNALRRRSLEQERQRLESQLQRARRLETVGALASGIAHNFNNIIGAILGYAEMAGESNAPSQALEGIRRAGERGRELVDEILSFAGNRAGRHVPVDMRAVSAEATSLLRASLPETVELLVYDATTVAVVSGVHAQLLQVILNLCNNAAQAIDRSGRVELTIECDDVAVARSLSHGALPPGRYVRVTVRDEGRGIDAETLERIFEPFFTTRATGNGLGLATVREIVREHGGVIHMQSRPNKGTRCEVWLPRINAPIPEPEPAQLVFGQGETLLVLESSADRLLQDEELLAAIGYEPVGFKRFEDALAACLASPDRFDAAVIGHVLPTGAALGFASALRRTKADLPILLATSPNNAVGAAALAGAGVSEVVPWPIKAAEIAMALDTHLRSATRRRLQPT